MQISYNDWIRYKNMLAAIDEKAAELMVNWLASQGGYINVPKDKLISYAYALASKYGEASAAAAAQMYDEIAEASGVSVPAAEVAETATYGEMAKAINGVTKKLTTDSQIGNVVGRHAKLAGADTMLKNALRDGAEFAWIPSGDTCAFCIMLASNGWQRASKKAIKGGHAEHIHANCDCTYAIRFDGKSNVKGYDPEKYRRMYYGAEGDYWRDKLNSMRRIQYQENRDSINLKKRIAYAIRENNLEMYRKTKNTGVYSIYPELMSKKHIMGIVAEMGLDPKLVKYKIDKNKELIGTGYMGHISDDGKTITLYPDAFLSREQLVKTIGHENIHLKQVLENGKVKEHKELIIREAEAVASEQRWWDEYVKSTGYRQEN